MNRGPGVAEPRLDDVGSLLRLHFMPRKELKKVSTELRTQTPDFVLQVA